MCVDFWVYDVYRFINYGLREDKNRIGIKGLEDCGLKWGK